MYIQVVKGRVNAYVVENDKEIMKSVGVAGAKGYIVKDGTVWRNRLYVDGMECYFYTEPKFEYIEIPCWKLNDKYRRT